MKISNPLNEIKIKKIKNCQIDTSLAKALKRVADSSYVNGSPWSEKQFLDTLETKSSIIFIAKLPIKSNTEFFSKNLEGLLIATETKIEADVYMVAVSETYKNNHIGRKLFEAFIQFCKEQGIKDVYLEVRVSNAPAIQLYKRMSFEEVGRRKNYYSKPTEDALLMKLAL